MLKLVGLSHLSSGDVWLLVMICVCVCLAVAWFMDAIMGTVSFGVLKNFLISMLGVYVGLYFYNEYYGRLTSPNAKIIMPFLTVSIMAHLLVFALVRKVLKL
jgi:hypothetical protein